MRVKEIKKHNPQSFLDDLKRVREVMVYAECTNSYYQILKKDLLREVRQDFRNRQERNLHPAVRSREISTKVSFW